MAQKFKSKPRDLQLAFDDNVDVVERSSAIARLRFDGVSEIKPLLVRLFKHQSFLLRRDAVVTLVGMWHQSEYLQNAVRLLRDDKDETVRSGAAFALCQLALKTEQNKELIISELLSQLEREKTPSVQEECYKALLRLVEPTKVPPTVATPFKRERDVDWNLLKRFLH